MNTTRTKRYLATAVMLGALGTYGVAQAAICTVDLNQTNPDGNLTDATACGIALNSGTTADQVRTALDAATPAGPGLSWTFIDRDLTDVAGEIDAAFSITGVTAGTWLINKDAIPNLDKFIVTLGGVEPLQNDVSWFLIDTSAGTNLCTPTQSSAGWDLCGTWNMYGSGRNPREVGSMDLFAATQNVDDTTQAVPEPSTILLSGVGLLGLALGRKRVIDSKA
jgi:hypothetical protein